MALVACSSCGKEIGENAALCPGCGESPPKRTSRIALTIGAFILIAVGMRACPTEGLPDAPEVERASAVGHQVATSDVDSIVRARRVLRSASKDADSLQFRGEFNSSYGSGGDIVCGEVNGKNGFGGYAGFKRFIVNGQSSMIDGQEEALFESAWVKFCTK